MAPSEAAAVSICPDDTWANAALDDVPDPRTEPTAVWTGSRLIVWGGFTGDITLSTGGRYDPATDTWEATSTVGAPVPRYFHTAVWTGTAMIVWGGRTDFTGAVTDTGGRYDPVADAWTPISRVNAPSPRRGHTAVWTGNRMVVWGNYEGLTPSGGRYDPATDTWSPVTATNAPTERHGHAAVWTGMRMIVWGGIDNFFPGTIQNTGGLYDPVADSWTSTSTTGAPSARRDHTAVWTGSVMIVWGGTTGGALLRTGGRYNLATDSWAATSTTSAPSPRSQHTAVWTGDAMVVWGGTDPSGEAKSGGRYSPTSNTWAATSLIGAPTARSNHAAVWTGSRMIVWGGQDVVGSANSGGRYEPIADAWTPTSTGPGPTTRKNHTAVWTGSLMIVWGGTYGFQYLDSGGRYDPATDTWAPTSTLGAPAARVYHSATWTGERMVVWGGLGSVYFDTGGRYDPLADAWTPTPLAGAPEGRRSHSAIWTGSKVIVWGGMSYDSGSGQTIRFATGGQYDPVADAWTATSTSGAPAARLSHAATWTGSRMVVWGGDGGSTAPFLGAGGRYDPIANAWEPMATAGEPSARQEPSAVSVAGILVVWGGLDSSGEVVATGARYDPEAVATRGSSRPDRRRSCGAAGSRGTLGAYPPASSTRGGVTIREPMRGVRCLRRAPPPAGATTRRCGSGIG